jgi:hypothetical protein
LPNGLIIIILYTNTGGGGGVSGLEDEKSLERILTSLLMGVEASMRSLLTDAATLNANGTSGGNSKVRSCVRSRY